MHWGEITTGNLISFVHSLLDTEVISRSSADRASDDEFSSQPSQFRFAAGSDEIREKMKRHFTLRGHSIDTLSEPIDEHNLSRISELEGECSNTNSCSVEKDPEHTGNCKKADCVTPITAKALPPFSDPPSGEQMVDLAIASERTEWTHPMETGTETPLDCAPHAPRNNSGSIKRASHSNKWYSRRAALQRNFSANSRINSAKLCTQTHEAGGTFLSNLCDARPSAMSGFLGVTSAALAMARATSPEIVAKRTRDPSVLPIDDVAPYDSCNCCCATKVSNRCSSETNLISFASPIIIRTSHITRDNSTELVYPDVQHSGVPRASRASMHINLKKTNTRGLSASLGDLLDSSNLLEPRNVFANNRHQPQFIEQPAPWPKKTRADICGHNSPVYKYRTLSEDSNDSPQYQDRKAAIAPVATSMENQEHVLNKCPYQQLEKSQYPDCAANRMRENMDCEQCCPRCKYKDYLGKHAVSANHLAGLPKRKYGIDEISYDFMRASGAIAGFSQLRSVKDIKQEREKQEMCSALSAAIASSLDTGGAVAALAANTRPRFKANWIKKRLQVSSQDDPSLESRTSNLYAHDGETLDRSPYGSSFPHPSKQNHSDSFPSHCESSQKQANVRGIMNPRLTDDNSLTRDSTCGRKAIESGHAWEQNGYINCFSTSDMTKCLTQGDYQTSAPFAENSATERASCTTIQNSFSRGSINILPAEAAADDALDKKSSLTQEVDFAVKPERIRRPHYFQKAQMFRQSWRTQSTEQGPLTDGVAVKRRSLTRVDSDSEHEDEVPQEPRFVSVVVGRAAPNPVKTILVNNSGSAHANDNDTERMRRQRTFANKRQWKSLHLPSVNISEPDDVPPDMSLCKEPTPPTQQTDNRALLLPGRSECGYPRGKQTARGDFTPKRHSSTGSRKSSTTPLICEVKRKLEGKLTRETPVGDTDHLKAHESNQMTESHSGGESDSQETFSREAFQKQRQKRRQAMKRAQDTMAFYNVGYRLNRRKKMFEQRCLVTDFSLLFAILGIILMVIETELTMAGVYTKASMGSFILKSMITCTTLALVGLIIAYHVQVVRILSFDDSIEDWRIAWDRRRVLRLAVEILICAVHPFPGDFKFSWFSTYHFHTNAILSPCSQCQNGSIVSQSGKKEIRPPLQGSVDFATFGTSAPLSANSGTYVVFPTTRVVPVDIFLSLPMFLRLYLVFRVVVLHSKLFTDTGSRSIGAMNKVSIDTSFIFKTFMTISPGTILVGFILGFWLVLSWTLRVCESGIYDPALGTIFNAMWLIAVTFLSIGYGDVVANTYCGRSISIITGVLGSLCTALVVAVFARRLELSKAEKHVIQFMMENQLTKKMKFYAANVLRETWLIYKYTRLVKKLNASTIRRHQRKFLHAIHGLRQMKLEQRRLQDNANTLVDLAKTQTTIQDTMAEMRTQHTRIQFRLNEIEKTLFQVQENFSVLPEILRLLQLQKRVYSQRTEERMGEVSHGTEGHCFHTRRQNSSVLITHQSTDYSNDENEDENRTEVGLLHSNRTPITDTRNRLDRPQFTVSFESTQSQKPCSSDFLNVDAVHRVASEPNSSFLSGV